MWYNNKLLPALNVRVIAGVVRVGDIFATLVSSPVGPRVVFGCGFVRGWDFTHDPPVYVHEAAALHALRALREWLKTIDGTLLHFVEIRGGNWQARRRIRVWMGAGACELEPSAASGIVADIQCMPEWLQTDAAIQPFRLPDTPEEAKEDGHGGSIRLAARLTGRFRKVVIPQRREHWATTLPKLPWTTDELKELRAW